jgi:Common central domain of tyrosinase
LASWDARITDKVASVPFDRGYLEKSVLSTSNWSAPPATNQDSFAGIAGGQTKDCLHAFRQGFGTLENPAHNTMHGNYIGGLMGDPSTAALDPIFWSFHAYIDLLFLQWQQTPNHAVTTDPGFTMCIPKDAVSYEGDIYLTPKGQDFRPQDPDFRRRFLVDLIFIWEAHRMSGAMGGGRC